MSVRGTRARVFLEGRLIGHGVVSGVERRTRFGFDLGYGPKAVVLLDYASVALSDIEVKQGRYREWWLLMDDGRAAALEFEGGGHLYGVVTEWCEHVDCLPARAMFSGILAGKAGRAYQRGRRPALVNALAALALLAYAWIMSTLLYYVAGSLLETWRRLLGRG